ncbi:MAG: FHA domain-containing protein [Spirochaetales bacterium]|uniref:FHA domain-containing protein n=1 Tax=Candidatus Thalassospirochaeta sargassi TaxID=3119039 RepID=A0AAJ1IAH3_9SPIO|nr:FHA domain-containing protein [Spirochaetales bacterium]
MMTGNKKMVLYLLLGIAAGTASFAAVEILSLSGLPNYLMLALFQGSALGFIFGFSFGFADGIIYKELKSGLLRALIAAAAGAVTAAAAQVLASQGMLLTASLSAPAPGESGNLLPAVWRGIGWMLMGAAIGAIDGLQKKAFRRAAAGAAGGLIGGLTGGFIFEFLIRMLPGAIYIKAAGLIIMGAVTGLFIGEFERRFSFARLRILNGPLKDREYLIIKNKTTVGPGLRCDIAIDNYENLLTGLLVRSGDDIRLTLQEPSDVEEPPAATGVTLLNDKPLTDEQTLKYQDVIQLGNLKMIYLSL